MGVGTSRSDEHSDPRKLWLGLSCGMPSRLRCGMPRTPCRGASPLWGLFSIGSAYYALCRSLTLAWSTPLWKAPLPLKIKIFVWQLFRDRLPSGTEVAKQHGPGDGLCPLCAVFQLGTHIFFTCPATWFLWSYVCEALGPEWQTSDQGDFLSPHAHRTGRRRHLLCSWQ